MSSRSNIWARAFWGFRKKMNFTLKIEVTFVFEKGKNIKNISKVK